MTCELEGDRFVSKISWATQNLNYKKELYSYKWYIQKELYPWFRKEKKKREKKKNKASFFSQLHI